MASSDLELPTRSPSEDINHVAISAVPALAHKAPAGRAALGGVLNASEEDQIEIETGSPPQTDPPRNGTLATATSLQNDINSLHNIHSRHSIAPQLSDITYGSLELLSPWFPNADPDHPRAKTWRTWHSRREITLGIWFGIAVIVLLINLTSTIVLWVKYPISKDGVLNFYTGSCDVVKKTDTIVHVVINVLSTLLLGASNGCLQLLLAPTRAEVDRAHKEQIWLDIGVPNFRNLRHIAKKRACLWSLLALSSIPLHFLYNAAIFTALTTSTYTYAVVTEAFLPISKNVSMSSTPLQNISPYSRPLGGAIIQMYYDVQENFTLFESLNSSTCWEQYAYQIPFLVTPRSVLLVSGNDTKYSLLDWETWDSGLVLLNLKDRAIGLPPRVWTASSKYFGPRLNDKTADTYWKIHGNQIQYCLRRSDTSQLISETLCYLEGSPYIMLVVCICNLVKCISILWVLIQTNRTKKLSQSLSRRDSAQADGSSTQVLFKNSTLCTLGDAIASFLEHPDEETINLGIASLFDFRKDNTIAWRDIKGIKWQPKEFRWYQAASNRRWLVAMLISFIILVSGIGVFADGAFVLRKWKEASNIQEIWALGFGTTNAEEIVYWFQPSNGIAGLFVNVVIANIWQVLVSFGYILNNALLSSMLVGDEFAGFASERKTLRVSNPRGIQRSRYFISMPLRYGIPFMAVFSVEHWLLSQAMFIIRVHFATYVDDGIEMNRYTTAGYSAAPAMLAIILPASLILIQLLHAFLRKYPSSTLSMPLVSTNSAAISASCHKPALDRDAHLLPVQWGVISHLNTSIEVAEVEGRQETLKRCAFTTSRYVHMPDEGEFFVGRDGRRVISENARRKKTRGGGRGSVLRRWWPKKWLRRKTQ